MQGVLAAEAGDLQKALEQFNQAVQILPQRASAYNNRAQTRRLQVDTAGTQFSNLNLSSFPMLLTIYIISSMLSNMSLKLNLNEQHSFYQTQLSRDMCG